MNKWAAFPRNFPLFYQHIIIIENETERNGVGLLLWRAGFYNMFVLGIGTFRVGTGYKFCIWAEAFFRGRDGPEDCGESRCSF